MMSSSLVEVVTKEDQNSECPKRCVFCKSSRLNELKYGPMYHLKDTITHYFCLLFSAGLNQRGKDYEGILGFLPKDIQKEVSRSTRLRCYYCKEVGASIGCCNRRCRKMFHYPCGLKNRANYQFFGNFESYCPAHAKPQKITLKEADWVCPVCMGQVTRSEKPVQASCCSAAVFHKECMQKVALNAGYFFKCPTCNASQNFVQEMRSVGIYVPEQDATWETEPDAFGELLYQYSICDATECDCPKGRDYNAEEGIWSYARCRVCGAAGVHKKCGKVEDIDDWACSPCIEMEKNAEKEKKLKQEQSLKAKAVAEEIERHAELLELANQEANTDESEDLRMSNVIISSSCFHYFPYDQNDLGKFQKKQCLPDWRNLHLAVDLVKWLTPVEVLQAASRSSKAKDNNSKEASSSLKKTNAPEKSSQEQLPRKRGRKRKVPVSETVVSSKAEVVNMCSGEKNETAVIVEEAGPEQSAALAIPESLEMSNEENCDPNLQIVKVELVDSPAENLQPPLLSPVKPDKPAKSKCAIFPFVSNFLKAGESFRDKRRMEMLAQSESTQDKIRASQRECTPDKKILTPKTKPTPDKNASQTDTKRTPDRIITSQSKSTPDKKAMTPQSKSTPDNKVITSPQSESIPAKKMKIDIIEGPTRNNNSEAAVTNDNPTKDQATGQSELDADKNPENLGDLLSSGFSADDARGPTKTSEEIETYKNMLENFGGIKQQLYEKFKEVALGSAQLPRME